MKFRFLLIILFFSSLLLRAQEPNTNLIFSEVRMDQAHHAYVELCNMGDVAVDLAEFEFGNISPWSDPYVPGENQSLRLPTHSLNPGDTYVIAIVREWADEQALIDPEVGESSTKHDTWRLADLKLHASESPNGADPTDSITPGYGALDIWGGTYCYYLRHHFTETDSIVTDAVNGIFTGDNGRRPGDQGPSQVAGVPDATVNSILVRKFNVKNGNLDWEQARGVDIGDSEWIPIPTLVAGGFEAGRKEFWTVGNHGDFKLNAQSLVSETIDIDWDNKKMTVDWGARNSDSIMNEFNFAPGIAWHYHMARTKLDSFYTSVRTGDSLTVYACGVTLEYAKFGLIALAPSASEARVVPLNANNGGGWYTPYIVSDNESGEDSISNVGFDNRVDSLYKYLEKPEKASWEIVWVDGVARPDLKDGDILKVTSEDASTTKEYLIHVEKYIPSHNANLASITWPDIPDFYKGIYGWKGDTIPDFSPTKYNYKIQVPWDVEGIPALIAKPENVDTKIQVKRATSLFGSEDAKTVKFYTTAEDDTTELSYSVILEKEKDLSNVQPYKAEPFISQFVFRTDWRQFFIEICNPGNQPLDLSEYCIVNSNSLNPAEAITIAGTEADWASRFRRYVPGYVWQDEAAWGEQPGYLVEDLGVNTIVQPGDVFVLAWAYPNYKDVSSDSWPNFDQIDVNFKNGYNPWGIELDEDPEGLATYTSVCGGWFNNDYILYKITNDSVLNGHKPLYDPYDVEVVDVLGNCNNSSIGPLNGATFDQNTGLKRLPQYYKGNVEPGGSFGDGETGSEWFYTTEGYWADLDYGWPIVRYMNSDGIGSHEFSTITEFISTVSSSSYAVSDGYDDMQTIGGGVQEGITVAEFFENIISIEGQVLTISSGGVELSDTDVIPDKTVLTVVSPNGANTTKYTITVTPEGLDSDALLTSSQYTIAVDGEDGTVSGIEFGTTLEEVYENVTAPSKASLFGMFKADGSYASFTQMKHDSTFADVLASNEIFFEVIAQDGVTRINYQLVLNSLSTDAWVISAVFDIDQNSSMIKLIPDGTNVSSLFNNLTPAPGATWILENKLGQVRDKGSIYEDDILIVTAQDGVTQKTYTFEMYSDFAARYEANISSEVYTVNNQTKKVSNVISGVTVDEFLENISVSMGATVVMLDADSNPKDSGLMDDNDQIIVTSENGLVINIYEVNIDRTDVITFANSAIRMYPNPTTGFVTISGVKQGNTIRIFNSVGQTIETFVADSDRAKTSISDKPSGIYMITVKDGLQRVANIRFIKK